MVDQCYRKMASMIIIFYMTRTVKPHISSSSSEISTEDDVLDINRRSNIQPRDYGGLPIEFPKKEQLMFNSIEPTIYPKQKTQEEKTSKPVYPPLNRRFRRIYNPDEVASIESYPFMAALLVNNELWCGGVIIDKDKVLTAAHCLQLQYNNRFFREYVKMLSVRVGSTNATAGGDVLRVAEIYFHPNYKPQTLEFNLAVVKLHRNLTFGKPDYPVDSIAYSTDKVVPVDNHILFLGWGSVLGITGAGGEVLLQKVKLPVYDVADCQEVYGKYDYLVFLNGKSLNYAQTEVGGDCLNVLRIVVSESRLPFSHFRDLVTRTNFCAGYITIPKNVCNHDAGGPAIMDNALVGILSFSSKRCDKPDQPAVFSSVGAVTSWLENLGNKRLQLRNTAIKSPEMVQI